MRTGTTTFNGYGVATSLHRCVYCDGSFTVTPAIDPSWGLGCLSEDCPSYDVSRDVDLFWDVANEEGWVRRD